MISYTLTQTADVKEYLNISSATYDALFEKLVYGVSEYLQSYLGGRSLEEAEYTEYYDGDGSNLLLLRQFPVASVTSLSYKSGTNTSPIWNLIDPNNYNVDTRSGIIKNAPLPGGTQNIKVVYTAGYKIDFPNRYTTANHTLPHDLWMIATQLVAKVFDTRFSQGKINESVEGQSVNWTFSLTDEMKSSLSRYSQGRI
mgnify:CR=1 FL=1